MESRFLGNSDEMFLISYQISYCIVFIVTTQRRWTRRMSDPSRCQVGGSALLVSQYTSSFHSAYALLMVGSAWLCFFRAATARLPY